MQDEIDMTGNDFENLFRFLRVKLRPAGAQQDSFTPETESEHLTQPVSYTHLTLPTIYSV